MKQEVKQRWKEINMEGVGKAGEEIKGDKVGDDERGEKGEGWREPEVATGVAREEGEIEAKEGEGDTDETELEEEAEGLVLDDFFG